MIFPDLTEKQQRFWQLYCLYADSTKAYMEAYGSTNRATARKEGKKLLANPKITCRFERAVTTVFNRHDINADWIMERLVKIAVVCLGEVENPVTAQKMWHAETALRALETLGKCQGVNLFNSDQADDARFVIEIPEDKSGGDVEKWVKVSRRLDS